MQKAFELTVNQTERVCSYRPFVKEGLNNLTFYWVVSQSWDVIQILSAADNKNKQKRTCYCECKSDQTLCEKVNKTACEANLSGEIKKCCSFFNINNFYYYGCACQHPILSALKLPFVLTLFV